MRRLERGGWLAVAVILCALAIPWFLWDDATVVAGFPLWLWWHIGWMLLASLVFRYFAEHAWGIGIDPDPEPTRTRDTQADTEPGGDAP